MGKATISVHQALRARHADDTSAEEVTLGPAGSRRMDFWAMKKTWNPISTVGYEIKHTRADFLGDNKWPTYLPYVHQFYFACPWGIIKESEVPEGCGLMYVTQTGKARVKIKAPRREPDHAKYEKLLVRVLWGPIHGKEQTRAERLEYHKERIRIMTEGRGLRYKLARAKQDLVKETEQRCRLLENENAELAYVRQWCEAHGIDISPQSRYGVRRSSVEKQLKALIAGVDRNQLTTLIEGAQAILREVDRSRPEREER